MGFGIGYRWRAHESNLLLSVRLPSDGPGGVETHRVDRTAAARNRRARRTAASAAPGAAPSGFWWFGRPPR